MTSQKLSSPVGLFALKSFHRFIILGGRIKPIACPMFYLVIKMWKNFYKKPYQKWQIAVKAFKIYQSLLTGTHKKKQILLHRFVGKYTLFHTPSFFEEGMKILKDWVGGRGQFLKKPPRQKERWERKYKICTCDGICSF